MTGLLDVVSVAQPLTTFAALEAARMAPVILPVVAMRFWSNVSRGNSDACWPWQRARNRRGYGRVGARRVYRLAHRMAWEITFGAIPLGTFVLHHCDNPPCCNPAHLFLGSHDENMADMVRKGRQLKGSLKAQAKLTETSVRDIRDRYMHGETLTALSACFGVSISQVHHICTRKQWAHLQ